MKKTLVIPSAAVAFLVTLFVFVSQSAFAVKHPLCRYVKSGTCTTSCNSVNNPLQGHPKYLGCNVTGEETDKAHNAGESNGNAESSGALCGDHTWGNAGQSNCPNSGWNGCSDFSYPGDDSSCDDDDET